MSKERVVQIQKKDINGRIPQSISLGPVKGFELSKPAGKGESFHTKTPNPDALTVVSLSSRRHETPIIAFGSPNEGNQGQSSAKVPCEVALADISISSLRTTERRYVKRDIKAGSDINDSKPVCCATLVYPHTECLGCNH